MEIHPGVFVTSTATSEWRPDPEVGGGAEEHVLFDNGAMRAGLTRFASNAESEPPPWALTQTDFGLFPNPAPAEVLAGHGGFSPPMLSYALRRGGWTAAAERAWPVSVRPARASPFDGQVNQPDLARSREDANKDELRMLRVFA